MAEELEIAKKILFNIQIKDYVNYFNNYSFIYKVTNEKLEFYQKYFENKKIMLSVIGSSDQIFNAILEGVKEIEAFDISAFPKYFFYLKKASIKALTKDEFIDFYYKRDFKKCYLDEQKKCRTYMEKTLKYLEGDALTFWENLLLYFDWMTIYESELFSEFTVILDNTIKKNKFLQNNNYDLLKSKIDDASIKTLTGNITSIADKLTLENDLIYLSNIHNYLKIEEFKNVISKLKLNENGMILSYIFRHLNNSKEMFQGFSYEPINEKEGLMLRFKR